MTQSSELIDLYIEDGLQIAGCSVWTLGRDCTVAIEVSKDESLSQWN